MVSHILLVVLLGSACAVASRPSDDARDAGPEVLQRRRHLQEYNRQQVAKLRILMAEHLSQSPATTTPYPRPRRRRLASHASPLYATQCLYEPPPPPPDPETASETAEEGAAVDAASAGAEGAADAAAEATQQQQTQKGAAAAARRRDQEGNAQSQPQPQPGVQQQQGGEATSASVPEGTALGDGAGDAAAIAAEAATSVLPPQARCYLNPAILAHADFPDPETPIEIMLLKTGWTAYQCSFERRKGRCGTYRHEPYDCRWQEDQSRCAVPSDYFLPRLLTYLHCRDDAIISPFWDRCYRVGVLSDDNDWCGQSDSNWARCWWFEARNDNETDFCAPSPGGGVEDRAQYDEIVAQIRSGFWDPSWFGSCPTAELVYTIKAACNYTTPEDCAADSGCSLSPDLPPEYGMCRMRDDLIWDAMFGTASALFNVTSQAMAECAAAAASQDTCLAAGSFLGPDGKLPLDSEKFSDVIDLAFIEEVTPGGAAAVRAAVGLMVGLTAVALLRPAIVG